MSPEALLRIAAAVSGRRSAADMVRVEVPYARGMNMWKLEKSGFPGKSKELVSDIVKSHGGKQPKYEEDGLQFDVPADKADSAVEEIQGLSGIDKSFKKFFDAKKAVHWKREKGAKDKPVTVDKKADPKLDVKSEKYEQKLEKKLQDQGKTKDPEKAKPKKVEEEPTGILPDDPTDEWNELLDDFGVESKKRLRKPTPEAPPKLEKGKGKSAPKKAPKPAPKPQAPAKKPAGRRRPGPPPKEKFIKSLDRMNKAVRDTDDQAQIVEAVEDFLDGIRYDSWPEAG